MGARFWFKRFVQVLLGAFVVIGVAHILRGRELRFAMAQAGAWAIITAIVFTVSRFVQARRGQHCAICRDTPRTPGED